MGLWVRSQDKEILIFTRKFFINEIFKDGKIVRYSIDSGTIELGVYSSKEKALKVFDMIQYHINKPMRLCDFVSQKQSYYERGVFQMPQDSEVEK